MTTEPVGPGLGRHRRNTEVEHHSQPITHILINELASPRLRRRKRKAGTNLPEQPATQTSSIGESRHPVRHRPTRIEKVRSSSLFDLQTLVTWVQHCVVVYLLIGLFVICLYASTYSFRAAISPLCHIPPLPHVAICQEPPVDVQRMPIGKIMKAQSEIAQFAREAANPFNGSVGLSKLRDNATAHHIAIERLEADRLPCRERLLWQSVQLRQKLAMFREVPYEGTLDALIWRGINETLSETGKRNHSIAQLASLDESPWKFKLLKESALFAPFRPTLTYDQILFEEYARHVNMLIYWVLTWTHAMVQDRLKARDIREAAESLRTSAMLCNLDGTVPELNDLTSWLHREFLWTHRHTFPGSERLAYSHSAFDPVFQRILLDIRRMMAILNPARESLSELETLLSADRSRESPEWPEWQMTSQKEDVETRTTHRMGDDLPAHCREVLERHAEHWLRALANTRLTIENLALSRTKQGHRAL